MKPILNRSVRSACSLSTVRTRAVFYTLAAVCGASACADVSTEPQTVTVELAEETCATMLDCRNDDPCQVAQCVSGACVYEDRAALADAEVLCAEHACANGRVFATGLDDSACDATLEGEPCQVGVCTPAGCDAIPAPNGAVCTTDAFVGTCQFGACTPQPECRANSECDDGNPCTIESCRAGRCVSDGSVERARRCDSGVLGDDEAIHRSCARSGEYAGLCVQMEG